MGWHMIGPPRVEKATMKLSTYFAEMEAAPNDRPKSDTRSAFLLGQLEEGKFRTCEWACVTCKATGKLYRVNGKHTSMMLAGLNGSFPKGISVIVERYEADTLEDVASLYSTFDSMKSSRNQQDINRIFAGSNAHLSDIPMRVIGRCVTGMSYVVHGFVSTSNMGVTQEQKAHLLLEHPGFVVWANTLLHGETKEHKFLFRGPVIAGMFTTYQKAQKASDEFWTAVREGSGSKPSTPDRKLQKYLLQTSVTGGNISGKPSDDARAMYARCIHAWNAWRRGDDTDLKYFPNAKLPPAV